MHTADRTVRTYDVVALRMPIVFNAVADNVHPEDWHIGHHDHDGLMFALEANRPALERLRRDFAADLPGAKKPHDLVRPLVLRACAGEQVRVRLTNHVPDRPVGMHLVGGTYDAASDGAHAGRNPSSLVPPGASREYVWNCPEEGTYVFHDLADPGGDADSSNAHSLFGVLVVEPAGSWWTDPAGGLDHPAADGLFVDVHRRPYDELAALADDAKAPFPDPDVGGGRSPKYPGERASFREHLIIFHDEPAQVGPHPGPGQEVPSPVPPPPAPDDGHGGGHDGHAVAGGDAAEDGGGGGHEHEGSLMCVNYRAEPMPNREHWIWKRLADGALTQTVINEEQHHSSWMFGDPATPVLTAYLGDPVRIRVVHASVKETHVFHLHLYSWHHDPDNHASPIIDAITVAPQAGHTVEPLFGAGSVQAAPGDAIWHCHLYPHFHMGMWGLFRTFDTRQDGVDGPVLDDPDPRYAGRRVGRYPDGTRIRRLVPLPDRQAPPEPTATRPGFPLFVPGTVGQKSPVPPWPHDDAEMPADLDYRPATALERGAFNADPKPGELFTKFPHPERLTRFATLDSPDLVTQDAPAQVHHDVVASQVYLEFNDDRWHDDDGHLFYLADEGDATRRTEHEPLFFRCRHGEVLDLTLRNDTTPMLGSVFDPPLPPRELLVDETFRGELGLHVHMVKFDPIAGDGACSGWNYMSAPRQGKKMTYRWWADEEFGTIFTHDHLFANIRQRHGLYGALLVEPAGSTFHDPHDLGRQVVTGAEAAVRRADGTWFREACVAIGDWTPAYDRHGNPLNAPPVPGSHSDNGTMVVNYRCSPLRERGDDPARWLRTDVRDLDTPVFGTYAGDPLVVRLLQGAHEEQHSFTAHGLRWRRFEHDPASPWRNQQTLGLSEAFSLDLHRGYSPGDHLWRLAAADDTWLGAWGLIRAYEPGTCPDGAPEPLPGTAGTAELPVVADPPARRRFRVAARQRPIVYREGDEHRSRLVDPLGLMFEATHHRAPGAGCDEELAAPDGDRRPEPLVLRARAGETVEVELVNELPERLVHEPSPPRVPVEREDRPVSSRVSLHADLVDVDVRSGDGADVGRNPVQSAAPGESVTLVWHVPEDLEPGPVLLQDMADVRHHRHHGLVGTLVVEPRGATPYAVAPGEATARHDAPQAWTGARTTLVAETGERREQQVLVLQDGLRYWVDGDMTDEPHPPDIGKVAGEALDPVDQGHKAVSYGSERLDALVDRPGDTGPDERAGALALPDPATPTVRVPSGVELTLDVVCAADKPRNHVFTVHGHGWREWPHDKGSRLLLGAAAGVSCGYVRRYAFTTGPAGDYVYRSGVHRWALAQGMWGLIRVS